MNHSSGPALAPAQLSEARYRGILEQASDAILVAAADGRIVIANAAASVMLGYAFDELLGLRLSDIVSAEDLAAPEARMATLESGGRLLSERTFLRKDGTTIVVELSTTMLPDGSFQGIARDITPRRRAERALRDSERRLRAMFMAIPVPTYAWQRSGDDFVLTDYNDAANELTEGRIRDKLGITAAEMFVRTPSIRADIERCAATQQVVCVQMEHELVTTGRRLHFAVHYAPVCEDLVLVHTVDNTERLTAEAELRRREIELRQVHKLEALGRLAGGVAHDFNNLLTVITTGIDFLRERLGEGTEERADADEVRDAALRAAALTRQLLAFGRRQVLETRPLDINAIVTNIEPLIRRLLGCDVELQLEIGPLPGLIHADEGQVEQVIVNLVVNAQDAMPDGGVVRMRTCSVSIDATQATVSRRAGDYAVLSVEDTGIGMDQATQSRIFEPFFTTKGEDKGTGLGLATVHGIVQQFGGFIEVASVPGRGTAFHVYLPLHENHRDRMSAGAADAR